MPCCEKPEGSKSTAREDLRVDRARSISTRSKDLKVVLVGDASVGKTSLVHRFVSDQFKSKTATIGAAYTTRAITLENGDAIQLNIWDTGGEERFRSIAPMYLRNASIGLICYDVSREESFERAKSYWYPLLLEHQAKGTIVIAFVGNKVDSEERVVSDEAIEDGLRNIISHGERRIVDGTKAEVSIQVTTSAKTGKNVQELFQTVAATASLYKGESVHQRSSSGAR